MDVIKLVLFIIFIIALYTVGVVKITENKERLIKEQKDLATLCQVTR